MFVVPLHRHGSSCDSLTKNLPATPEDLAVSGDDFTAIADREWIQRLGFRSSWHGCLYR